MRYQDKVSPLGEFYIQYFSQFLKRSLSACGSCQSGGVIHSNLHHRE